MESADIVSNLEKIISKENIKQNEQMKNHTSFKIGGPAEIYIKITSIEELQNVLSNEEYSIISDNSNSEIKFKFKLIEFFTNNGLLTAKN